MLDLAIIGGGPAGLTAGLYATRGGLKNVVMFEKGMPGGQITGSSEVENYPGVSEVVTGMELMQNWPEQCQRFGLQHDMKNITRVSKVDDKFVISIEGGESIEAKTVLIATGSVPRRAGFKGEDEFFGRGISTCATCDGFFYKGKEVAVIGGGDTALEEAVYLAEIASKVYLVHRRDEFRAAPSTIERVQKQENIELVLNATPKEVYGDAMGVTGLLVDSKEKGEIDLKVPGVFTFVGYNVNNEVLIQEDGSSLCELSNSGEIVVDLNMKTNVAGLFAAGDIRIDASKQVVCAAADGATAALQAIAYINH